MHRHTLASLHHHRKTNELYHPRLGLHPKSKNKIHPKLQYHKVNFVLFLKGAELSITYDNRHSLADLEASIRFTSAVLLIAFM